jgi:hypothetical protein
VKRKRGSEFADEAKPAAASESASSQTGWEVSLPGLPKLFIKGRDLDEKSLAETYNKHMGVIETEHAHNIVAIYG